MKNAKSIWKFVLEYFPVELAIGPFLGIGIVLLFYKLIAWLRQPWRIEINRNQQ